jgi:hypothetical protein
MHTKIAIVLFTMLSSALVTTSVARADNRRMYAGDVDGQLRAGVSIEDGRVLAFLCGDGETVRFNTRWFKGDGRSDGQWHSFEQDGWKLWIKAGRQGLAGWVARPGRRARFFNIARARDGEGLYRGEHELGTIGVILTREDGRLQLRGALQSGRQFLQVVPLASLEPVDGRVRVQIPGGVNELIAVEVTEASPASR